jgi:hypothetical protein
LSLDDQITSDWHYRPVSLVLPAEVGTSMRGRVTESTARGGRITVRPAAGAAPVGTLFVRWDDPEGEVTVHRIGWDAANGGSELVVRRALAQLGERALTRS